MWMSLFAGSHAPWLSVPKIAPSGPKPMPLGVRRPPATYETSPVSRSILIDVPRFWPGCGLVVAPPLSMATERLT